MYVGKCTYEVHASHSLQPHLQSPIKKQNCAYWVQHLVNSRSRSSFHLCHKICIFTNTNTHITSYDYYVACNTQKQHILPDSLDVSIAHRYFSLLHSNQEGTRRRGRWWWCGAKYIPPGKLVGHAPSDICTDSPQPATAPTHQPTHQPTTYLPINPHAPLSHHKPPMTFTDDWWGWLGHAQSATAS